MNPARKLEAALVADVFTASVLPALDGLAIYPGLNAESKILPRMHVVVDDVSTAAGFEGVAGSRERVADLYIGIMAAADNDIRDAFCEQIEAVEALFAAVEDPEDDTVLTLQGLLNAPADSEAEDTRTVKDLFIYQADYQSGKADPLEKGIWQYLLHYRVQFIPSLGR